IPVPAVARGADLTAGTPVEAAGDCLIAYGLTAQQEGGFAATAGVPAEFWASCPSMGSAVISPGKHGGAGEGVLGQDITAQAAYSRAGLYLLFVRPAGRVSPVDAIDFHIARLD